MTWLAGYERIPGNSSGAYIDVPKRGVLHSTEGSSVEGAVSAYRNGNSWPHSTVDPWEKLKAQHVDLDVAARAMFNGPKPIETNRAGAVQIEIVMFADLARSQQLGLEQFHVSKLGDDEYAFLREVMREHEAVTGIRPRFDAAFKPYPASYGENNGVRLSDEKWYACTGWVGHMNIPDGNDHGDPGALSQLRLVPPITIPPEEDPMPLPVGPAAKEYHTAWHGGRVLHLKSQVESENPGDVWVTPVGKDGQNLTANKPLKKFEHREIPLPPGALDIRFVNPVSVEVEK